MLSRLLFAFVLVSFFPILSAFGYEQERIQYVIKPLGGRAEYIDLGLTQLNGREVKFTVFKTAVVGFKDTEKIYSDPQTLLPIKVERNISKWLGKEYILEEYDQNNYTVTITKFKGKRKVSTQVFQSEGPIANAILVPFYLRKVSNPDIGWSMVMYLPQKYKVSLDSLERLKIGQKEFLAYHFKSVPNKFEIWISQEERVPIKIKGMGKFKYVLLMKEHTKNQNQKRDPAIYAKEGR